MKLNVTHRGESADLDMELEEPLSDDDVKRIAAESLDLPGLVFRHYVVDRGLNEERIYLRPKVPFG